VSLPLDRKTAEDQLLLKGMPQANLQCQRSGVTDLSPLKDLPLTKIECDFRPERDAKILRALKTLTTINGKPAAEFWERHDKGEFKE